MFCEKFISSLESISFKQKHPGWDKKISGNSFSKALLLPHSDKSQIYHVEKYILSRKLHEKTADEIKELDYQFYKKLEDERLLHLLPEGLDEIIIRNMDFEKRFDDVISTLSPFALFEIGSIEETRKEHCNTRIQIYGPKLNDPELYQKELEIRIINPRMEKASTRSTFKI